MPRTAMTIAVNGVPGRMGHSQHLARSILAIRAIGERHGLDHYAPAVRRAIAAGKHVYVEAPTLAEALEIGRLATLFRLAGEVGLFPDPGLAAERMQSLI